MMLFSQISQRYRQWLLCTFRAPGVRAWQTRSRRALCLKMVAGWSVLAIATILAIGFGMDKIVGLGGLAIIVSAHAVMFVFVVSALNSASAGLFELYMRDLDEFQVDLRNSCYRWGFVAAVWLLVIAVWVAFLGVISGADDGTLLVRVLNTILLSTIGIVILPRVVAVWTLRNDPPDDPPAQRLRAIRGRISTTPLD